MDRTRTRAYRDGALVAEDFVLTEVSDHLAVPGAVVWIDFCAPSRAQLDEVADELGLHDLAVEDALEPQRPKLDHYQSHLFLSLPTARLVPEAGELSESGVAVFIGDRWLVTVRRDDAFALDPVVARWDRFPDLARSGVGFLLWGLVDVVVDGYFDSVQDFDDFYDRVSEGIFRDEPIEPSEQRTWFEVRRALVRFHRLVVPLREAVSSLMRREHGVAEGQMYPYYQDVYDHVLRVSEATDSLRDLVSSIVETNLSLRDYRQNQVMKKVTSWAAIIAVPTLITGYYGMNVPYPGFARTWGLLVSVVLMVVCSVGLYTSFKRRDWL
ncbi:magnesium transporter CorA family protein [Iamia majanohamensis]|uniref:Magnesium transporter CorA family protein n=1 Tax=Iamia majanohamensis TaxID=467976 RepID=A0AAE9YD06_9ACTN|nr:magnesium transporter CorA family protein [Iamia majanohamensis]WCO68804.1 magnesium transporter CorA family protein [Iamia majanohamensis]